MSADQLPEWLQDAPLLSDEEFAEFDRRMCEHETAGEWRMSDDEC